MTLALQLLGILLVSLVVGVYWGPWLALTRTISALPVEVLLPVVRQLNANLAGPMTALVPLALLGQIPLVVLAVASGSLPAALAAIAFVLFLVSIIVTVATEVPIVKRIVGWQVDTLPADWMAQRDRWASFHLLRVIPGLAALMLYVAAAIL